ncbi:MAG: FAD-dependent oxidoreductase [Pirellulales bacterium]|nr:FAD-dependent oxidoreductase [Pirellulales bacterium]
MDGDTTTAEPDSPPIDDAGAPLRSEPTAAERFDLVIVGGDPAGYAAAREGRRLGMRVALVSPELAVLDPAVALATEHALRQAARRAAESRFAGWSYPGNAAIGRPDPFRPFAELRDRAAARPAKAELARMGVVFLHGQAAFTRRDAIEVGGCRITFRKAVVAIGLSAVRADDAAEVEPLLPELLVRLEDVPPRLAILGEGPRACGWAQAFRRLGSEVHLVGRQSSILPEEDAAAVAVIQRRLAREGVHLVLGCTSAAVQRTGAQKMLVLEQDGRKEKRLVDRVFQEVGCVPELASFRLELADVALADDGIAVDDRLRTTNRRIFAAGKVCGKRFAGPETAEAMGRLCARNASCLFPSRIGRLVLTHCVRTDPQIARVGLTPSEAAAQQIEIDTYRVPMCEVGEAVLDDREEGFVEVYTRHGTGRMVGAVAVADRADELIGVFGLLIARRMSLDHLADGPVGLHSRFDVFTALADCYRWNRSPSRWRLAAEKLHSWWRKAGRS